MGAFPSWSSTLREEPRALQTGDWLSRRVNKAQKTHKPVWGAPRPACIALHMTSCLYVRCSSDVSTKTLPNTVYSGNSKLSISIRTVTVQYRSAQWTQDFTVFNRAMTLSGSLRTKLCSLYWQINQVATFKNTRETMTKTNTFKQVLCRFIRLVCKPPLFKNSRFGKNVYTCRMRSWNQL